MNPGAPPPVEHPRGRHARAGERHASREPQRQRGRGGLAVVARVVGDELPRQRRGLRRRQAALADVEAVEQRVLVGQPVVVGRHDDADERRLGVGRHVFRREEALEPGGVERELSLIQPYARSHSTATQPQLHGHTATQPHSHIHTATATQLHTCTAVTYWSWFSMSRTEGSGWNTGCEWYHPSTFRPCFVMRSCAWK